MRLFLLIPALAAMLPSACAPARDSKPASMEWRELFDGSSLAGWQRLDFGGEGGEVSVTDGLLSLGMGTPFSAVVIADPKFKPPGTEYEISVRARRTDGLDFFCALTFPVPAKNSHCTFVAGGWGGGVTGLSNIDSMDANNNPTRSVLRYQTGRWYELRVEVRRTSIRCWVDDRLVVNANIDKRKISMRPGAIEQCVPFGLASWETTAQIEHVRVRRLPRR